MVEADGDGVIGALVSRGLNAVIGAAAGIPASWLALPLALAIDLRSGLNTADLVPYAVPLALGGVCGVAVTIRAGLALALLGLGTAFLVMPLGVMATGAVATAQMAATDNVGAAALGGALAAGFGTMASGLAAIVGLCMGLVCYAAALVLWVTRPDRVAGAVPVAAVGSGLTRAAGRPPATARREPPLRR